LGPFLKRYSGLLVVVALAVVLFGSLAVGYVRDSLQAQSSRIVEAEANPRLRRAIDFVKDSPLGQGLKKRNPTFVWQPDRYLTPDQSDVGKIFIVCLCNDKGNGWRWEVNTQTGAVVLINETPALQRKYRLHRVPPPPR